MDGCGLTQALGFGVTFYDLGQQEGLIRLDRSFLDWLVSQAPSEHADLISKRASPERLTAKEESDLIVALGPYVDAFLAELFGVAKETALIAARTRELDVIHTCKRLFVQRQA